MMMGVTFKSQFTTPNHLFDATGTEDKTQQK